MSETTETNEREPLTAEERELWTFSSAYGGPDDNVFTRSAMRRAVADLDRKDAEIERLTGVLVSIEGQLGATMTEHYGAAESAAARAKLTARKAWREMPRVHSGDCTHALRFGPPEVDEDFGVALDALEAAQKEISDLRYTLGYCDEYRLREMARAEVAETVVARLTADHERQRDHLAALQVREAELEAEVARLTHILNEQGMEPDNVGHLVVDTVAYTTDNDAWHEEWLDFYTPANWMGSHRGAAAFLASKIRALADENASLLRRVESLRMAVWGEKHREKAP